MKKTQKILMVLVIFAFSLAGCSSKIDNAENEN